MRRWGDRAATGLSRSFLDTKDNYIMLYAIATSQRRRAMRRTQISLDQSEYDFLRREAKRRGKSMTAIVRELVRDGMGKRQRLPPDHPLRNIIALGRGDGAPVSEKHDMYLYGRFARRR